MIGKAKLTTSTKILLNFDGNTPNVVSSGGWINRMLTQKHGSCVLCGSLMSWMSQPRNPLMADHLFKSSLAKIKTSVSSYYSFFWDILYVERFKDCQYSNQIGSKKSSKIHGRFVGCAWNVGHTTTFKILTDNTKKIVCWSCVRLAINGENNLKLDAEARQIPKRVCMYSKCDDKDPEDP